MKHGGKNSKKYEIVYHKITCHFAMSAESDDEVSNDPVLSGVQVMLLINSVCRSVAIF